MKHESIGAKRRVNLLLDADTVEHARALGLNMSQLVSRALAAEVKAEQGRRWEQENRAALESSNAWVERHGLPLARYRLF